MNDLAGYLLDNWGFCSRDIAYQEGKTKKNDCYWGRDSLGRPDGCLYVGWKGRSCPHWRPSYAITYEGLKKLTRG